MDFDLVVTGGTVVDGTGAARYRADMGIAGGRIAAIARDGARLEGSRSIDATDKVIAPGFVDTNSHVDWIAPLADQPELLAPLLLQGVTTSIGGGCGYSPAPVPHGREAAVDELTAFLHDGPFPYRWSSFSEFLSVMEAARPLVNVGFLVGQNTVRDVVLGLRRRTPTPRELGEMTELTRRALRDGALGLSGNAGMRPGRFAEDAELAALARIVATEGGVYAVHARAYTAVSDAYPPFGAAHNVRAVRDLIKIATASGVRLQISHLLFAGRRTWRTAEQVLAEIQRAYSRGTDVAFDAVPYTVGGGPLELLFPGWFVSRFPASVNSRAAVLRLRTEFAIQRALVGIDYEDLRLMSSCNPGLHRLEGLDFAEIARTLGVGPLDAEIHVARESAFGAMVLFDTCSGSVDDDTTLQEVLRHPLCAFITNATISRHGAPNPAWFGAFPRVLGHFSRDLRLFSLEEAIRRMTSYPAERIGLNGIGRVAEGLDADLVVLDPDTVGAGPSGGRNGHPSGIDAVILSGQLAAASGEVVSGPRYGRVLRRAS